MKKIIALALAMTLVLALGACGADPAESPSTGTSSAGAYQIGICQLAEHLSLIHI